MPGRHGVKSIFKMNVASFCLCDILGRVSMSFAAEIKDTVPADTVSPLALSTTTVRYCANKIFHVFCLPLTTENFLYLNAPESLFSQLQEVVFQLLKSSNKMRSPMKLLLALMAGIAVITYGEYASKTERNAPSTLNLNTPRNPDPIECNSGELLCTLCTVIGNTPFCFNECSLLGLCAGTKPPNQCVCTPWRW